MFDHVISSSGSFVTFWLNKFGKNQTITHLPYFPYEQQKYLQQCEIFPVLNKSFCTEITPISFQ